jgi:hypothetical protein
MQEGLGSPEGGATLADIPNFCDTGKLVRVFVEEVKFVLRPGRWTIFGKLR